MARHNTLPLTPSAISTGGIYGFLILFSVLGVLTRIGLVAVSDHTGFPLHSTLLALFVGCWVYGVADSLKPYISKTYVHLAYPLPPDIFLTQKFCTNAGHIDWLLRQCDDIFFLAVGSSTNICSMGFWAIQRPHNTR